MHLFGRRNKEKRESKKQTKDSSSTNENVQLRHVLGVSLANAIQNSRSFDGQPIPALIRICLDYVALHG
jgi:hypothetical protein